MADPRRDSGRSSRSTRDGGRPTVRAVAGGNGRSGPRGLVRGTGPSGAAGGSRPRRRSSTASTPGRGADHVRWSKVLTAQARIAVGYYERADVKQRVIDALLKELSRR